MGRLLLCLLAALVLSFIPAGIWAQTNDAGGPAPALKAALDQLPRFLIACTDPVAVHRAAALGSSALPGELLLHTERRWPPSDENSQNSDPRRNIVRRAELLETLWKARQFTRAAIWVARPPACGGRPFDADPTVGIVNE